MPTVSGQQGQPQQQMSLAQAALGAAQPQVQAQQANIFAGGGGVSAPPQGSPAPNQFAAGLSRGFSRAGETIGQSILRGAEIEAEGKQQRKRDEQTHRHRMREMERETELSQQSARENMEFSRLMNLSDTYVAQAELGRNNAMQAANAMIATNIAAGLPANYGDPIGMFVNAIEGYKVDPQSMSRAFDEEVAKSLVSYPDGSDLGRKIKERGDQLRASGTETTVPVEQTGLSPDETPSEIPMPGLSPRGGNAPKSIVQERADSQVAILMAGLRQQLAAASTNQDRRKAFFGIVQGNAKLQQKMENFQRGVSPIMTAVTGVDPLEARRMVEKGEAPTTTTRVGQIAVNSIKQAVANRRDLGSEIQDLVATENIQNVGERLQKQDEIIQRFASRVLTDYYAPLDSTPGENGRFALDVLNGRHKDYDPTHAAIMAGTMGMLGNNFALLAEATAQGQANRDNVWYKAVFHTVLGTEPMTGAEERAISLLTGRMTSMLKGAEASGSMNLRVQQEVSAQLSKVIEAIQPDKLTDEQLEGISLTYQKAIGQAIPDVIPDYIDPAARRIRADQLGKATKGFRDRYSGYVNPETGFFDTQRFQDEVIDALGGPLNRRSTSPQAKPPADWEKIANMLQVAEPPAQGGGPSP